MTHVGFGGRPIATTGGWRTGKGGVFFWLWSMMSNARAAFFPSSFTLKENITNSAFPLILLLTTPPPAVPASSPVLMRKLESFVQTGLPSIFTFLVPFAVSVDMATFG